MESIYLTEVTEVGPEVAGMLEAADTLILFESGAPPELAEISVLHEHSSRREEPPAPGDVVAIGPHEFGITAVGETAWKNVLQLGHASFKFNGAEAVELPGEICLQKEGAESLDAALQPGTRVEIKSSAEGTG